MTAFCGSEQAPEIPGCRSRALAFQITHATDSDTNAERDYIVAELIKSRSIGATKVYQSGQGLPAEHINHYITDGEIMLASLMVKSP